VSSPVVKISMDTMSGESGMFNFAGMDSLIWADGLWDGNSVAVVKSPAMLLLILVFLLPAVVLLFRHRKSSRQFLSGRWGLNAVEIEPRLMPIGVRAFFDAQDTGLRSLGFSFLGDCEILRGPQPVYCRYYAGPDSQVYAELAVAKFGQSRRIGPADLQAITLVTVFEDDVALQTCDLGDGGIEDAALDTTNVIYRFRPFYSHRALLEDHLAAVAEYADRHQIRPRRYPPEQIVEVSLNYAEGRQGHEGSYQLGGPPVVHGSRQGDVWSTSRIQPLTAVGV